MKLAELLPEICRVAFEAGDLIEEIYQLSERVEVESKSDGTPVTVADKQADALICEALTVLTPDIPLLTEESVSAVPFEERQSWSTFWCVDPLDGTKEFIERTGEFSVNIGLVENGQVVLGVVYVPMTRVLYCAAKGLGAYRWVVPSADAIELQTWQACLNPLHKINSRLKTTRVPTRVAVSRRHGNMARRFFDALGEVELVYMGSAIKSCLVAEGTVDLYPRFGPTSLWDTAAAQCVVEESGGLLVKADGKPLTYVQTESLLNPHFLVVGDPYFEWPPFPQPKNG